MESLAKYFLGKEAKTTSKEPLTIAQHRKQTVIGKTEKYSDRLRQALEDGTSHRR